MVAKREKDEKKALALRKEGIKSRSDHTKDAQKAFNRYIRIRDKRRPCISSGRITDDAGLITGSRTDAGHYRSIGSAAHLRFNTDNCHAQSVKDNRDLSGNTVEYRKGLIHRIGLDKVERLENDNGTRKFSIEYLKRIKFIFNKRALRLEKRYNSTHDR